MQSRIQLSFHKNRQQVYIRKLLSHTHYCIWIKCKGFMQWTKSKTRQFGMASDLQCCIIYLLHETCLIIRPEKQHSTLKNQNRGMITLNIKNRVSEEKRKKPLVEQLVWLCLQQNRKNSKASRRWSLLSLKESMNLVNIQLLSYYKNSYFNKSPTDFYQRKQMTEINYISDLFI